MVPGIHSLTLGHINPRFPVAWIPYSLEPECYSYSILTLHGILMLLSHLCLVNHMDSLNYQWSRYPLESLHLWPWYFRDSLNISVVWVFLGCRISLALVFLGFLIFCGVGIPWIPSPLHPGYSMDSLNYQRSWVSSGILLSMAWGYWVSLDPFYICGLGIPRIPSPLRPGYSRTVC